jgi:hypothetical protein
MNKLAIFWRTLSRGTRFQVGFYSAAFVVGALMFFGPRMFASNTWGPVLTGIGIALVASSVLGFAQRLFFYDDFRTEMDGLVEGSLKGFLEKDMLPFLSDGVERLYVDRDVAIREFVAHVRLERERIIVIGSSLKGLLDATERDQEKTGFAAVLREKIRDGVPIEFLLTHPALAFLREDAEGRKPGAIKAEIIDTLRYLTGIGLSAKGAPKIGVPVEAIRLYHGTPTIFSIILGNRMLINPYAYQATAYENFCFEFSKKSEQGLYAKMLKAHYRKPWDNKDTCTPLTEDVMNRIDEFCMQDLFPNRLADLVRDRISIATALGAAEQADAADTASPRR